MSSQTNHPHSLPGRAARATFLLCLLALLLPLGGCGYGFATDGPSVLEAPAGGGLPTLKIKSVNNPSLYSWLSYVVRTEVRDEIAARDLARWVDSGRADYEIAINVSSFTVRSAIVNSDDYTMLYSANMVLDAIIYRGNSNEVLWRSGSLYYSQSYERVQEREVAVELSRELSRQLASAMRQAF